MDTRWLTARSARVAIVLLLQLCSCTGKVPASKSKAEQMGSKVVCYYTPTRYFPATKVPSHACTHLLYAFGTIQGGVTPSIVAPSSTMKADWGILMSLREANPELKVMLSLQKGFHEVVGSNITKMQQFASNAVTYLRKYQFDGVDMDYEFPSSSEKSSFSKFFQFMRTAIEKDAKSRGKSSLLLSLALPNNPKVTSRGYDIPTISNAVDFGTVMAYDFHVYSSGDSTTGYNSPLLTPAGELKFLSASAMVNYTLSAGFLAKKLLLGIPTYGRSWKLADASSYGLHAPAVGRGAPGPYRHIPGIYLYPDSCVALQHGAERVRDLTVIAVYLHHGTSWVAYDDDFTVLHKCKWAADKGLGGLGVWALHLDDIDGVCGAGKLPLISTIRNFTTFF